MFDLARQPHISMSTLKLAQAIASALWLFVALMAVRVAAVFGMTTKI